MPMVEWNVKADWRKCSSMLAQTTVSVKLLSWCTDFWTVQETIHIKEKELYLRHAQYTVEHIVINYIID